MTDPVSGGIGKASQQMMQELQKQMQQEIQQQQQTQQTQSTQFEGLVSQNQGVQQAQQVQDVQKVTETTKVADATRATDVLKAAVQQGGSVDPSGKIKAPDQSQASKGLKKLLGEVVEGQNKLDDIIKMATSGKQYGQQDLLAIQASVYKFSQELDLTSKVVEKATSGVKQTMQTQV